MRPEEKNSYGITYAIARRAMMRSAGDEAMRWPHDQVKAWFQHVTPHILHMHARWEVESGTGAYTATEDFLEWISANPWHEFTRSHRCTFFELPVVGADPALLGALEARVSGANKYIAQARRRR